MTQAHIGVIGVGTMGSALALNFAEKGQNVALWNLELDMVDRLSLADLVTALPVPRAIVLMIPAGRPVDQTIAALLPLLSAGDTIIDGGNSDFRDTMIRTKTLEDAGLSYLGIGVSGGAEGARRGPSMMVGGTGSSYSRVAPILEAIAARYAGDPCVAHLGPDGAGHFVKTVHNGIEYADMQMIAEVYGMMRDGAVLRPAILRQSFVAGTVARWKAISLKSPGRSWRPKIHRPVRIWWI